MTGFTMTYDTLIEQYNTMVSNRDKQNNAVSPENQEVLNKVFNELILSLEAPLLEFVDILLENVMYPTGGAGHGQASDRKKSFDESVYLLGNGVFLEIIHLRNLTTKLIANARSYDGSKAGFDRVQYIPKNLKYLQNLHILLIFVLQRLSEMMENSSFSQKYYKKIIVNSIEDFKMNFQIFKLLDKVLVNLFNMALQTGDSDSKIFTITDDIMDDIKRFTDFNKNWYIDLMTHSNAFEAFMSKQSIYLPESELGKIVVEPKFQNFLSARKVKLNISTRKVF
ncbi:hypothetical protein TPHA_0J01880 [Tetrapisispora phaffii CBS 4417]|uniref:Uncharacterized protein n=1 Tax=Tetrapisispora phaffii (strain ATCC 24235 / CBS 4417 / NBRC 1672 / NRRL Y-8282 / UCD 70-5) TaxID=1071381 RepID=G8BYR7_TETPH|nr:hypothetical protein TPHA_0J01880 [Tetrapisispora phaffii CBS 4417]CCE65009.1 hypothetical protein TPHA_0J01880 [Tetrapisispora phaffii CBS 4417]